MPLEPGQKLASYEILAPLGAGGMGEVWRARDTRLGRDVAIKALPDAFARDPERMARFEREAKLLASVNHANIGAIYGLEVVDGHRYLVLEFLEGESLSSVLSRGALPVAETVEICGHVAGALEAAHEAGIVHRDLKPGNVMILRNGGVKVLDFGLAKADGGGPGSSSDLGASASPTMTYGATQAGMVLGTAAYMSPEQARGRVVDRRTDIWSFGCVLYECLTGRQAFAGETVSDLIAHILTSEPDWNALPPTTPPRVRELLRRCLEKDARRRLRDMGDARLELEETLAPRGSSSYGVPTSIAAGVDASAARRKPAGALLPFGIAVVAALVGAAATFVATLSLGPKDVPRTPARFAIASNDTMQLETESANLGISADGSTIAFVARDSSGTPLLWVRSLNGLAPRALHGTENAQQPFFSPDGQSIGFFTETRMKRISLTTGDVDELYPVKRARGGTWNRRDEILFAPNSDGPLFIMPASGGDARQVTTLDTLRGESGQRFPNFLPDGRHFLYTSLPPAAGRYRICIGDLNGGKPDSIASLPGGVRYAEAGWFVYPNTTALMAQRFDLGSRKLRGAPLNLRDQLLPPNISGSSAVALAGSRALAYLKLPQSSSRIAWFDAAGREVGQLPLPEGVYYGEFAFSPDGRRAIYNRVEGDGPIELWIGDVITGAETRFESVPVINAGPHWSADGTRIAWMHSQGGPQEFVVRNANGTGEKRTYLADDHQFKTLNQWTPDGKSLLFSRQAAATRYDLYLLDLESGKAKPLIASPFNEQGAQVSPDGRWIAYSSDETGRSEIYVQPYPSLEGRVQVTTAGATRPGWTPRGQLMYALNRNPFAQLISDVLPGSEFRVGPARTWFTAPATIQGGDLTPDGRLAAIVPAGRPEPISIVVILDWLSGTAGR